MSSSSCVIYTRVSTEEQAQNNTSLADQQQICRHKAAQLGLHVAAHFEDAGVSGALYETRLGLQNALAFIESGQAKTLIVAKIDRLARDRYAQSAVARRLKLAGARVIFCNIEHSNTPEGELQIGILGDFAVYERQVFRARSMAGRKKRAEDGFQSAWKSPFGYHIPTKAEVLAGKYAPEERGKYLVVEEQAQIVRRIFAEIAAGGALLSLCKQFYKEGIKAPAGGTRWYPPTLLRILRNRVYVGEGGHGKTRFLRDETRLERGYKTDVYQVPVPESEHTLIPAPPIVPLDVWERANAVLDTNKERKSGNPAQVMMLTGLLLCSKCGKKLRCSPWPITKASKGNPIRKATYFCKKSSASRTVDGQACLKTGFRADELEKRVEGMLLRWASNPKRLEAMLENGRKNAPDIEGEVSRLQSELDRLSQEETLVFAAQMRGLRSGADTTLYERELGKIAEERGVLTQRLNELKRADVEKRETGELAAIAGERLALAIETLMRPNASASDKREVLSRLVESITPHPNGDLEIKLRT